MPYPNQTNDIAAGASPIVTVKDHNYLADVVDANHILDTKILTY
jgi:hypothetical protein